MPSALLSKLISFAHVIDALALRFEIGAHHDLGDQAHQMLITPIMNDITASSGSGVWIIDTSLEEFQIERVAKLDDG